MAFAAARIIRDKENRKKFSNTSTKISSSRKVPLTMSTDSPAVLYLSFRSDGEIYLVSSLLNSDDVETYLRRARGEPAQTPQTL